MDDGRSLVISALGEGYSVHQCGPLLDSSGQRCCGAFDRGWKEVEWSVPELRGLTALQRGVIWALLEDHEPLWTIVRDSGVTATRAEVEAALEQLEGLGLVDHTIARRHV